MEMVLCARVRTFRRNELLFAQGQPVRNLTLLQSGSVKLTQVGPDGNEFLLWMSRAGDAINVQPETDSCTCTCSARAMERCNALEWEYGGLQSVLAQYPQIRANISHILAGRLQELEERFREIATETVAKRLALTLLRLTKTVGRSTSEGLQISLIREELAQMTGTTLFTISRILSNWARKGLISARRESVVISDPERFEAIGVEDE